MKYSFFNDYSEGAHPDILKLLVDTNSTQEAGYGEDSFSLKAADLIRKEISNDKAHVHFVSAGTQANFIVLASILRPHESVIAADTAHISVHEAGAVEATGHRINTVPNKEGKIMVRDIEAVLETHVDEHMVKPRVVFISQSTEVGTMYSLAELKDISRFCKEKGLYLYIDGARLGSALASIKSDVTLADIARLADAFYIGGTKNGALIGEAVVICNQDLQKDFRYYLKQRGALLAKGRVTALQFIGLFENDLYMKNARHANDMAGKLVEGIKACGYDFMTESSTNQIFPILPNSITDRLRKDYGFYVWAKIDADSSAIRLVTSWATPEQAVEGFVADLRKAA